MAQEFGPERKGREMVMYRVGVGDTLGKVAKQFSVDVEDLARDNGLDADSKLREGSLLKLLVDRSKVEHWGHKGGGGGGDDDALGAERSGGSKTAPSDKPKPHKGSHKSS